MTATANCPFLCRCGHTDADRVPVAMTTQHSADGFFLVACAFQKSAINVDQ
jgi:hypothetical protein